MTMGRTHSSARRSESEACRGVNLDNSCCAADRLDCAFVRNPEECVQGYMLAKKQRRKFRQISPPHHPCVHARCFDVGVIDSLLLQPFPQVAVGSD